MANLQVGDRVRMGNHNTGRLGNVVALGFEGRLKWASIMWDGEHTPDSYIEAELQTLGLTIVDLAPTVKPQQSFNERRLLDEFAMAALTGLGTWLVSGPAALTTNEAMSRRADMAYRQAEAMMRRRNKVLPYEL